ncbi:MAG: hypothetical protein NZM43_11610 [Saprospiraceae bacterium]|nr:hypothetical protein [Saprospiraceae bacterium]MDW8484955.1 hypothetical protein [Saprospiraceae bacterium]
MSRFIAHIFSLVGHPFLVLTYALILLLLTSPYEFGVHSLFDKKALTLLLYVFSSTVVIPGIGIALMKPLGLISNLQSPERLERIGPYIITGVFYLWLYQNLKPGGVAPPLFRTCVLGATFALFGAFFVNIFTKVSAHAAGMGGLVGMLLLLAARWPERSIELFAGNYWIQVSPFLLLVKSVLLAGIVGWARLHLELHTPRQVWYGYAIGFVGALSAWWMSTSGGGNL